MWGSCAVWRPDNPEKSVCRPLPNKCLTRTDRRPSIEYKPTNETLLSHPFVRQLFLVIPQPSICIFTIWHHIAFPKGVTHTLPRVNARSPAFDSCLPCQHTARRGRLQRRPKVAVDEASCGSQASGLPAWRTRWRAGGGRRLEAAAATASMP